MCTHKLTLCVSLLFVVPPCSIKYYKCFSLLIKVYDTWAKEWNGEGCVLGMGVGQLDLKHNEGSNTLMHGGRHVVLIPVHVRRIAPS